MSTITILGAYTIMIVEIIKIVMSFVFNFSFIFCLSFILLFKACLKIKIQKYSKNIGTEWPICKYYTNSFLKKQKLKKDESEFVRCFVWSVSIFYEY